MGGRARDYRLPYCRLGGALHRATATAGEPQPRHTVRSLSLCVWHTHACACECVPPLYSRVLERERERGELVHTLVVAAATTCARLWISCVVVPAIVRSALAAAEHRFLPKHQAGIIHVTCTRCCAVHL